MGGCLSIHRIILSPKSNGADLHESTFSHYSLTSESSYLDLYPTFHYVESLHPDSSSCNGSVVSEWRRSSVPLIDEENEDAESIDSDYNHRLFKYSIFNGFHQKNCTCIPMFNTQHHQHSVSPSASKVQFY